MTATPDLTQAPAEISEEAAPKKQLAVILSIVFLCFLGLSIPYLIMPSLFLNPAYSILPEWLLPYSPIILGVTLAAYPLGQFIGSPILGELSDEYGCKKVLFSSLFLTGACYFMSGLALKTASPLTLIFSQFGAGAMEGNIAIARTMASSIKGVSKYKTFGKIDAASTVAYIIGPILGGVLFDVAGLSFALPFFVVSLLFFCLSALVFLFIEEKNKGLLASKRSVLSRINYMQRVRRLKILFNDRSLRLLFIISGFFALSVDMFYEFGPSYLTQKWLLSPADLSAYNAALCITLAIGSGWLAYALASRYSNYSIDKIFIAFFALILILMPLADGQIAAYFLYAVAGFAIAVPEISLTVQISDKISDAAQGEIMGIRTSFRVLCDGIICLFGGFLMVLSSKTIFFIAAAVSLVSALFHFRHKNQQN